MKKLIGSLLIFSLGLMLLTGCQSASTPSGTSVPASSIASDIGTMAKNSLAMDNGVLGVVDTLSISSIRAATPATPTFGTDSFWVTTDSYTASGITFDSNYKFRVWNATGTEITTLADLQAVSSYSDISKIWTYTTITYTYTGGSYSISYGSSVSDPLKFDYASNTISGPITMTSAYSGTTYSISLTYSNLTASATGYPTGLINWSMSEGGSTVAAGTVTFIGTSTATITFTSGYSGTYTVDLTTGLVTSTIK